VFCLTIYHFNFPSMKCLPYILLLVLMGCSTSKEVNNRTTKSKGTNISKLSFKRYYAFTAEAEAMVKPFGQKTLGLDSTRTETLSTEVIDGLNATRANEIYIELKDDAVWRYKTRKGQVIDNYKRIDTKNGILLYHAELDKSTLYGQEKLPDTVEGYEIEEFRDDKKKIMRYNCYKVVIRKKEFVYKDDIPREIGETIYEMYVTEDIDLPVYALFNFSTHFSDFFPLEVRITASRNINVEIYEVQDIIKGK